MDVKRRHVLGGLLASGLPLPAWARQGRQPVIVPIGYDRYMPAVPVATVPVKIDGKGPFPFAFTTSSDFFVIDADLAEELALKPKNRVRNFLLGSETQSLGEKSKERDVGCESIEVGDLKLSGNEFLLSDIKPEDMERHRKHLAQPGGNRGLLGTRLFLSTPCIVDFDALEIRFYPGDAPDLQGFAPLDARVDSHISGGSSITLNATLDGSDLRCMLDLVGHADLYLTSKYVRKHKLWDASTAFVEQRLDPARPAKGLTRVVRMKDFRLGTIHFDDINVTLGDPGHDDHLSDLGINAAIGGGLAQQLILGFNNGQIYARPGRTFSPVSPSYRVITQDDLPA